jgi:hypothetical protein
LIRARRHSRKRGGFSAWKLVLDSGDDVFRGQHVVARHAAQAIKRFLFSEGLRPRDAARAQDKRKRGNSDQSNADENEK